MPINDVLTEIISNKRHNKEELTSYLMFNMQLKQRLLAGIMKED
jgi:hypothetical protein